MTVSKNNVNYSIKGFDRSYIRHPTQFPANIFNACLLQLTAEKVSFDVFLEHINRRIFLIIFFCKLPWLFLEQKVY